ncbi:5'-3' exoribonuclease 2-like [Oppia nitens]|uniref:5'-3' exoribonuclease 2-like n=1 Tax=Oppia nitens TaxID=1686743 RepID=UPI0023DAD163|nr:5'-3' exoribonuclease 2-like [Oppia nitens]
MGVPAFFRWLSKKYPSIVVECDDAVRGNAYFDNLYLDMNGIIHPCSHPEYKAAPETEEDMFLAIFEYIENIMKIVKPKKLLYMAVDGCAPRAKMNQQRSRRFRASQESIEKLLEIQKIKQELRDRGIEVKDKPKEAHFDSNVITPGTQFMINLSHALRQWIDEKLSSDNEDKDGIWPKDLIVILSDASVPGEGEHKIMEYIRKQKAQTESYNPNLSHCLYGADADLIMLGLATHELNFTILREEFKPNQPRPCDLCGQLGHDMKECMGTERPLDEEPSLVPTEPEFIYIRLCVLREYLEKECSTAAVHLDFERFIDDFVFLCFFVGNDFLPHLPSLEIRENAIDRLISIYKDIAVKYPDPNPYLTKDGTVRMERVQYVLQELGEVEDEIFKQRQDNEIRFKERRKRQKLQQQRQQGFDSQWMRPEAVVRGQRPQVFDNTRDEAFKLRATTCVDNLSAAQKLKAMLKDGPSDQQNNGSNVDTSQNNKRKSDVLNDEDSEPEDLVQLYNEGWKERYYLHKFDCSSSDITEVSSMVAREYVIGLCWVLMYYYQGCCDWKWFYPFHYAPFASDCKNITEIEIKFDRKSRPFRPLEQLMSVFPAASSQNLPPSWRALMTASNSSIIDFYPNTFKIDLNGKKAAWMGVALLPFIDEERLFSALTNVYNNLTEDEIIRNSRGSHLIFVSKIESDFSDFAKEVVNSPAMTEVCINSDVFRGISGTLCKSEKYSSVYKRVFCAVFEDPVYDSDFIFPALRLPNAKAPQIVLKPEDLEKLDRYNWRPTIGMKPHYQKASISEAGMRMFGHSYRTQDNQNPYSNNREYNRDRNANYGQYNNPYNRQHLTRDSVPQQYNSYYKPPNSYSSNHFQPVDSSYQSRRYQSNQQTQSSSSSNYRNDRQSYGRNPDHRSASNTNSYQNSGNRNQRSDYQSDQQYGYLSTNFNPSTQNYYQTSDRNDNRNSRQHPYDINQRSSNRQQPYYGTNSQQRPNQRSDPWNRHQ